MLYDFSYKFKHGVFLMQNLYDFSYKFKQGAFLKQNLYDFSYKFKQGAFLKQILYDFSLLLRFPILGELFFDVYKDIEPLASKYRSRVESSEE